VNFIVWPDMRHLLTTTFVLASNSPRRRELVILGGWSFRVQAADVDENIRAGEDPAAYVLRLAQTKARCVGRAVSPDEVVVAADTTVVDDGHILGKPADALEAIAMLKRLRGHIHQVYTAIAVLQPRQGVLLSDLCTTDVPVRNYDDDEISAYVASGDPLDKAGAYAIQNRNFRPVLALSGCYASVMGLPLCHLSRLLHQAGVTSRADLPQACQAALNYECDFYPQVLGQDPDLDQGASLVSRSHV
jgi:septum formation protein